MELSRELTSPSMQFLQIASRSGRMLFAMLCTTCARNPSTAEELGQPTVDVSKSCAQTCGDVNSDGIRTVTDGVRVLRFAAGLGDPETCDLVAADANGDGKVTVSDGVLVLRSAAGLPAQLSCAAFEQAPIGVRIGIGGTGEFYDTGTGAAFVPRGNNYIRLDGGYTVDPGVYDTDAVETAFSQMEHDGYNVVRFFLSDVVAGLSGNKSGINPAYAANLVDFLDRAQAHGIRIIVTGGQLPPNYASLASSLAASANVSGENAKYMNAGSVLAYGTYLADIATTIKNAGLIGTVFSFDLRNEPFFVSNEKPFSLTSGTVTPASGGTYDLSSTVSRQKAADDSAKHWANSVAAKIRAVDASVLLTASVFTPRAVGREGYDGVTPTPDTRSPMRLSALAESELDYLDLHFYPQGAGYSMSTDFGSAGVNALPLAKPRVIGEFGAFKNFYPTAVDAGLALSEVQDQTCDFGFQGWLLWTWDTWEQPDIWNAMDAGGAINGALAPLVKPNVCP